VNQRTDTIVGLVVKAGIWVSDKPYLANVTKTFRFS